MDDRQLISRLIDGEIDAVGSVREWVRAGLNKYRRQLGDDAEDLEQEILLSLTEDLKADRFDGRSTLRTYVTSRVYYTCIDHLRGLRRREWVDLDDTELRSTAPSPLQRLSSKQKVELAQRMLAEIPTSCRELWAYLQEGLGYREMSRKTGVSEVTLRTRVMRCRQKAQEIRKKLQKKMQRNPAGDD